jgi:14-3-3 protein epsilon
MPFIVSAFSDDCQFLFRPMTDGPREVAVFMARVAQECQLNDDCIVFMRDVIGQDRPLSYNERNTISSAYKGQVGPLRDAIRLLQNNHDYDVSAPLLELSDQLCQKCDEVVNLIKTTLLPAVKETEVRVFYVKMAADYLRYKWEGTPDRIRQEVAQRCKTTYQEAVTLADAALPTYHPLRLGLSLNFAVFLYEVVGETSEAHALASRAYSEAGDGINQLSPESKAEATHTLELLRENVQLWQK